MPSTAREATATIRGYLYQFHATIRRLMILSDQATLTVEGIEDYDVVTADEAVHAQVKYYAAQKLTDSVLRDALLPMLEGFLKTQEPLRSRRKHVLYGYFRDQPDSFEPLNLADLKRILVRGAFALNAAGMRELVQHNLQSELGASDEDLQAFADSLTVTLAEQYESHKKAIIKELSVALGCSRLESENYSFPTAVTFISDVAGRPDASERVLGRDTFLSKLAPNIALYNEWAVREAGEADYCRQIRSQHFAALNVENLDRFFILSLPDADGEDEALALIHRIITNWSTAKVRNKPDSERFAPYIFLPNSDPSAMASLKGRLFEEKLLVVDGYPYKDAPFSLRHLKRPQTKQNLIAARFVGSTAELEAALNSIERRRLIVQLYSTDPLSVAGNAPQLVIPIKSARMAMRII